MLRFFLNGILVNNQPIGTNTITERLYYSEDLRTYLNEINGKISFWDDEYDYIYNQWKSNSCGLISLEIQKEDELGVFRTEFKGFIFLSDVIFNETELTVDCEIVDNSFIAKIDNNKSIQMNMLIARSKNLVDISSYYTTNPTGSIFTYSPSGGTYNNRLTISVYDAFAALVAFMSDGDVLFHSDFFDYTAASATEGNQYFLVTGHEIFNATAETLPVISFSELFDDMNKIYNLRIGIEKASNGKPLLRIEPKSYFRETQNHLLSNIDKLSFQRKATNQFTKIFVGSEISDEINNLNIFDYIWNSWKSREYFLQGQCNEEELELNLALKTINADVRVIESVQNGTVIQDTKVFMYAEPIFSAGSLEFWNPFEVYVGSIIYNNKNTTNGRIIDRWQDDIFSPVANLDYQLNDMRATLTSSQTISGAFQQVLFDNDSTDGNYDNGNSYDPLTGEYTCLITGTYRIKTRLILRSTGGSSTFDTGIAFGFAGGALAIYWYYPGTVVTTPVTLLSGETLDYEIEFEAPLLEGTDIAGFFEAQIGIQVNKTAGAGTLTVEPESYIEILTPASGTFRDFTANDAYSKEINFTGSIDSNTWKLIKENKYRYIDAHGATQIHRGYIQDIERNVEDGTITGKTIGRM